MAAGGHFRCPKITFDLISIHFTSIRNFILFGNFWQNGWRRPFWMSEIHFRSHFWPFQIDMQLFFVWIFLTKWLPAAILDFRNSHSIAILAISIVFQQAALSFTQLLIFLNNIWKQTISFILYYGLPDAYRDTYACHDTYTICKLS